MSIIASQTTRPPTARDNDLAALAARVRRLLPDRRDPEAFHVERSEIAAALLRLSRRPLANRPAPPPSALPRRSLPVVRTIERVRVVRLPSRFLRPAKRPRLPRPPDSAEQGRLDL